jgi:signal peptidase I
MAVTISASPNSLNPVENGLIWVLLLGDRGTDPEEKRAGWKLESSAGVVAELSSTRPGSTSDPITLDFKKNIRGLMKTKLPAIGALGVQNDTDIIKEFKLTYGDIVINKETGTVTNNVTTSTGYYKVFNGANNIWDAALITAPGVFILSYRPTNYNILRNSLDYIWVLGSTTVTYTVYYSDNTTQSIVQSAPYDANIVPVGLPFLSALLTGHDVDDVTQITIAIGSTTYYVGFEDSCDGQSLSFMEVLFLEPAGGRSVMVFQDIDNAGVQTQSTEANIFKTIASIDDLRNAGDATINKTAYGTYSLRRQTSNDPDETRWMHGFGASTEHHLLLKDRAGTRFWAKFILDGPPTFNLASKEMTCSGRLAKNIDAPYAL